MQVYMSIYVGAMVFALVVSALLVTSLSVPAVLALGFGAGVGSFVFVGLS